MTRHRVELVDLDLARHALLAHKHGQAQALGVAPQIVPAARAQRDDLLPCFIGREQIPHGLGNGPGGLRRRVGKHIDQLHGVEQLHASEDACLELQRGIALFDAADADIQHIAQSGRAVIDRAGLFHKQLAAQRCKACLVRNGQLAPVVGDGHIGIHQIVGIEDDLLRVHFGPAHLDTGKAAKVLSIHGSHSGFNSIQTRRARPAPCPGAPDAPRQSRAPS